VTAFDERAAELIEPNFTRQLRTVAPVAQLEFEAVPAPAPAPVTAPEPVAAPAPATMAEPTPEPAPPAPAAKPARNRKARATVPAWEDVLLGVRSGTQR
jgi:cell division septation protein DedD